VTNELGWGKGEEIVQLIVQESSCKL
jgi:hypothetical protein